MQRAAEEVGMAAFDAICSAQKGSSTRRLEPYLSLPYLTLPSEGADEGANACTVKDSIQTFHLCIHVRFSTFSALRSAGVTPPPWLGTAGKDPARRPRGIGRSHALGNH